MTSQILRGVFLVGNSVLYIINTSPRCNYGKVISQLGVLASHKRNFESVARSRRLGIIHVPIWEVLFFLVTLVCLDISSMKSCFRDISHIILKHTQ